MAAKKQNPGTDAKELALVGAGLAAIAAGAYFFFGPDGKKHQKKMKGWMVRMKGEVLERLEDAKSMSEDTYNEIVNAVAKTYEATDKIPKAEIIALASELKKQWKSIRKSATNTKRAVKKSSRLIKRAPKIVSR